MAYRSDKRSDRFRVVRQINEELGETHPNISVNLTGHHVGPYCVTIAWLNKQELLRVVDLLKGMVGRETENHADRNRPPAPLHRG